MKPIVFNEANILLTGNGCKDLPACQTTDGHFVSCWKPSFAERLRILFQGRLWLGVIARNHPPVFLLAEKPLQDSGKGGGNDA